jgi:DNA repair exonuclease SbcCD ATPase subunit
MLEALKADGTYVDEGSHARLEADREAVMRRVFEVSSEKEKAFSQGQVRRNESATIRKNIAESKARLDAAAKISQRVSKAKAMQNALVEVQESLRTRLISAVNYELSAAWARLYPYDDYSSARLSPLSDDYALELCTVNGEWVGAERASGGERSIASLALRMSFARVLAPRLDVLILDEPTHNLDSAGITALSAALREAVGPGGFSQVFVITHEDGLRDAAEATALYEFSRSKQDSNGPTTVSRNGQDAP